MTAADYFASLPAPSGITERRRRSSRERMILVLESLLHVALDLDGEEWATLIEDLVHADRAGRARILGEWRQRMAVQAKKTAKKRNKEHSA